MQLSNDQIDLINRYTDAYRIDRSKLTSYLEKHKTIKAEVFSYCSKVSKRSFGSRGYCTYLDDEPMYTAVDRDTFIRRIPFYFYQMPMGGEKRTGLSKVIPVCKPGIIPDDEFNLFYHDLEWMFYDLQIPLDDIFNYIPDQLIAPVVNSSDKKGFFSLSSSSMFEDKGLSVRTCFRRWQHYLHLCQKLGWNEYFPERFISRYNYALEESTLDPIIYEPLERYNSYFSRDGQSYVCKGNFPCDKNGIPVMRWTSIRAENPAALEFSGEKSRCGELKILLSPSTIIHAWVSGDEHEESQESSENETVWYQIYAGPQTMRFNHEALKEYRIDRKMTQQEVADAVDTSVRTYQKWESGATTPDCQNLLRLMNWLNIEDVQSLIIYKNYTDN